MALFQPLSGGAATNEEIDTFGQLNRELRLQEIAAQYAQRSQETDRQSSTCTQVVWMLFWLTLLIVLVYPLSLVAAVLYALLSPLALIDCLKSLVEMNRHLLDLPLRCAQNMVQAKQLIHM